MMLSQLHAIKLWMSAHRDECPLEYHAWDLVLTAWVMSWMGQPGALLLGRTDWALMYGALFFVPGLYVLTRRRLHHAGVLRCDWLEAVAHRRAR